MTRMISSISKFILMWSRQRGLKDAENVADADDDDDANPDDDDDDDDDDPDDDDDGDFNFNPVRQRGAWFSGISFSSFAALVVIVMMMVVMMVMMAMMVMMKMMAMMVMMMMRHYWLFMTYLRNFDNVVRDWHKNFWKPAKLSLPRLSSFRDWALFFISGVCNFYTFLELALFLEISIWLPGSHR